MGSTLSNYFSIDFEHRVPKKNCLYSQKIIEMKILGGKGAKLRKKFIKLAGGVFDRNYLCQKNPPTNDIFIVKSIFAKKMQ